MRAYLHASRWNNRLRLRTFPRPIPLPRAGLIAAQSAGHDQKVPATSVHNFVTIPHLEGFTQGDMSL